MTSKLEDSYSNLYENHLVSVATRLEDLVSNYFENEPRIDRISARPKTVGSFIEKANKIESDEKVYSDPLNQIQDQIGVRVITFYKSDVDRVCDVVNRYFRAIEDKLLVPESESEFGYFGRHFVLFLPSDVFENNDQRDECPDFFELQVKTLYQHAWSEANHDLGYKSDSPLNPDQKRKIAFTAAQSWGADLVFSELFDEMHS